MNKEYKKILKNILISTKHNDYVADLQNFLDKVNNNPNLKIITYIQHQPFYTTIIYQELMEIKK